ncbi:hypothetical protein [Pseudomonas sp. S32]|uniref:hypothetical protein n=1 Tax=Pseudomonas sp. S32 TaxID=2767448 RepID=UPI001911FFE6|nr:hypothetical protein [Pseudomonas sp. S32]MBK5007171.1 hypothetical protein [Pseudomonas sp. S32]
MAAWVNFLPHKRHYLAFLPVVEYSVHALNGSVIICPGVFMNSAEESEKEGVFSDDLFGWSGYLRCYLEHVNTASEEFSQRSASQRSTFEMVITPGRQWFAFSGQLTAPLLAFSVRGNRQGYVSVSRRVSNAVHLLLGKEPGAKVREVRRVEVYLSQATVGVESELWNTLGSYRVDGNVVLSWQAPPRLYFIRDGQDDPALAARFNDGMRETERPLGWLSQQQHYSHLLAGATFRVVLESSGWAPKIILYFAVSGRSQGQLPPASQTALPCGVAGERSLLGSGDVLCHVDTKVGNIGAVSSESVNLPNDLLYLPDIIYPHRTQHLRSIKDLDNKIIEVEFASSLVMAQASSAPTPTMRRNLALIPAMVISQRGGQAIPLTVDIPYKPNSFRHSQRTPQHGVVRMLDGELFYEPPPALALVLACDEGSKTTTSAALKTNQLGLVSVDILDVYHARSPFIPASAAFLIYNTPTTHFFRMSKAGDALRLTLHYVDKRGNELAVDPADIEWKVLAGDGAISQEGILTPSQGYSGCTAIQAVEYDDVRWYWSAIIIPPLSVDELLALQ